MNALGKEQHNRRQDCRSLRGEVEDVSSVMSGKWQLSTRCERGRDLLLRVGPVLLYVNAERFNHAAITLLRQQQQQQQRCDRGRSILVYYMCY